MGIIDHKYVMLRFVHPCMIILGLTSLFIFCLSAAPAVLAANSERVVSAADNPLVESPQEAQSILPNNKITSTTLFFDDFSGDLSNWDPQYGGWSIVQDALAGDAYGCCNFASIYAGDTSWSDYIFQTRIVTETISTVMIFRSISPWQTEYHARFWWEGSPESPNKLFVQKFQDGIAYDLTFGLVDSPVPITSSSLIKILVSGVHIIIYVDDQYVTEVYDPDPIPNGRIGLGIWDATATFDDVLVTTPPPVMLYPIEEARYAKPGELITYTLELVNYSGFTDSFNLEILSGAVWTTTLSTDEIGPIENGSSAEFYTRVEVPPNAQAGDSSVATIKATSIISPSVSSATSSLLSSTYSGNLAYISEGSGLVVVDQVLHTNIGYIDLIQYDCMQPGTIKLTPGLDQIWVFCAQRNNIIVFSVDNTTYLTTITLPTGGYEGDLTFTRDGAYAIVGAADLFISDLYVIDTDSLSIITTIPSEYPVRLVTHPYRPLVYISEYTCCYYGHIQVLDISNWKVNHIIDVGFEPRDLQISPDGRWLYVLASENNGSKIFKIDTQTYALVASAIFDDGHFNHFRPSADGSNLIVLDPPDGFIRVLQTSDLSIVTSIPIETGDTDLELTCDGAELWIANETNPILVFDAQEFSILYQIEIPYGAARGMALCSRIYTGIFTTKIAEKPNVSPGEKVGFKLSLYNQGDENLNTLLITDTLPAYLDFIDGSLTATSGTVDYRDGVITWTGGLSTTSNVEIGFSTQVEQAVSFGTTITNTALFNTSTEILERSSVLNIVPWKVYIPCAFRACGPAYIDNFSDPNSGWPIGESHYSKVGYINGEYQILVKQASWLAYAHRDFGVYDYKLEVDTHPENHLSGATGLVFDITDNGFFLFEISNGYFSLWRYDPGGWFQRIYWTQSSALYTGNRVNHLEVIRKQSEILLYANGKYLADDRDNTYHSGQMGMLSEGFAPDFDGRFDNFAVSIGVCVHGQSGLSTNPTNLPVLDIGVVEIMGPIPPEPVIFK